MSLILPNLVGVFFLFSLAHYGYSATQSQFEFTVETISLPILSTTSSTSAKKDLLGEIYNPLGIKYHLLNQILNQILNQSGFDLYAKFSTSKISLITNKDKDNGLSTSVTLLGLDLLLESSSTSQFKTQAGFLIYEMKGSGGTKVLRNGSSTAEFDLPSRTVYSQDLYVGAGYHLNLESFFLEADLNILSLFSQVRRNFYFSLLAGIPL